MEVRPPLQGRQRQLRVRQGGRMVGLADRVHLGTMPEGGRDQDRLEPYSRPLYPGRGLLDHDQ